MAPALGFYGAGMFLQKVGDRRFERKGDTASIAGGIAMATGLLCLLLALVMLLADDIQHRFRYLFR